jgi:hypothetical protein
MAGKGASFENSLLKLYFNATNNSLFADNTATTPLSNLYCSLHTADPGPAGTQNTSEIAYTSYARVAVPRTSGGFTVTTNSVSPSYWALGTLTSGAGVIMYSGAISPTITCGNGITPILTTSSAITES